MTTLSSIQPKTRARFSTLGRLAAPMALLLTLEPREARAGLEGQGSLHDVWLAVWGAPKIGLGRVDGLSVTEGTDGSTILRLKGLTKPTFNVYRLDDPSRLVVDLANSERGTVVPHLPLDTWACGRVTVDSVAERGVKLVRFVVQLKRESSYIVVPDGDELVVTVSPRDIPPEAYFARKSAEVRQKEIERDKADALKLRSDAEADALKVRADAEALRTEALALREQAASRVREADDVAALAHKQAEAAGRAVTEAEDAETRARERETKAREALDTANSHRGRERRVLREAEDSRKQAVADRIAAEQARGQAQAQLSEANADAERRRREAELALDRAAKAEAAAEVRLAEATSARDEARRTLDEANVHASATTAAAERTLARAQQEAERAEVEATRRLRDAEKQARSAEATAERKLAEAEASVARQEDAARKRLVDAKEEVRQAELTAERARVAVSSANAEAKRTLEAAQRTAAENLARAQQEVEKAQRAQRTAEMEATQRLAAARSAAARAQEDGARVLEEARAQSEAAQAESRRIVAEAQAKAAATLAAANAKADADAKRTIESAEQQAERRLADAAAEAEALVTRARARADREGQVEANKRIAAAETAAAARIAAAKAEAEERARQDLERAGKEAAATIAAAKTMVDARVRQQLQAAETQAQALIENARARAEEERKARLAEAEAIAEQRVAAAEANARTVAQQRLEAAERKIREEVERTRAPEREAAAKAAEAEVARLRSQASRDLERAVEHARAQARAESSTELASLRRRIEADAAQQVAVARSSALRSEAAARTKIAETEAKLEAAAKERRDAQVKLEAATKASQDTQTKLEAFTKASKETQSKLEAANARLTVVASESATLAQRLAEAEAKLAQATVESRSADERLSVAEDKLRRARIEQAANVTTPVPVVRSEPDRVATNDHAKGAESADPSPSDDSSKGVGRVRDVRFESDPDEERIVVETEGLIAHEGGNLTPTIQLLRLSGARMPRKLERSFDASDYAGPVKLITAFREGRDAKLIVSTVGPVKTRLEEQPGRLVWHFPRDPKLSQATSGSMDLSTGHVVDVPASKVAAAAPGIPVAAAMPKVGHVSAAMMAPAESSFEQADISGGRNERNGRWRGERIDIELQEAPIKDVLLLFSDIGRVNIIAGRGVEGVVTMKLSAVPWDQALDIILRSLSLGSIREGNVIRVATLEDLEEERRQSIERANAQIQLRPLETRLLPVSYATVDEMVPKVQSVLSPRGTVTPDTRTNTLIMMDVAENISLAEQLVRSLDTQTPQVLIEARIVEARTTFTRQLGIQWGFDFVASPGTGNPTGLLFPNSLGIGGGGGGQPSDVRGLVLPGAAASPNYAVDLPAPVGTGAGGAIGFSFGSISGNLNTNLRLSAAESTGEVRIISAPKIVTLDNSQAQIEQGVQIPISQVSAQGVNTRFVNATLSLEVTPHVTNEGAVLLEVRVQKNEADFVNTGARGDPTILTRQAESRMLVNDNDTAVIGGIYTRNKAVNSAKVPWLGDIPIIGWFFKNKTEADTRSEVLIFLTPKIVNRASSIGG